MKKKTIIILIVIAAIVAVCAGVKVKQAKEQAFQQDLAEAQEKVNQVDKNDYLTEDQEDIEKIIKETKEQFNEVKNSEELKKVMLSFKMELEKIPDRKAQIENVLDVFRAKIDRMAPGKREQALKVMEDYKAKLKSIKSWHDLHQVTSEMAGKIAEKMGETAEKVNWEDVKEKLSRGERAAREFVESATNS